MGFFARGRLTQAQSGGRASSTAYDAKGRLLSTTDPLGRKDSLFYDAADRLTRRVLPDGRAVTFAYDSSERTIGEWRSCELLVSAIAVINPSARSRP